MTILGLPLNDLPSLLAMKDGIIQPQEIAGKPLGHPDTDAYQAATAASIYEYFTQTMAEHKLDPCDGVLKWFLETEIDGRQDIQIAWDHITRAINHIAHHQRTGHQRRQR